MHNGCIGLVRSGPRSQAGRLAVLLDTAQASKRARNWRLSVTAAIAILSQPMQIPTRPSHVDPRANCTAMHSEPVHWRESSSLGKLTHGGFLPRLELKPKAGISPVGKTPAPWGRHQGGAGRRPPTGSVSGSFGPAENFSKLFRVVLMAFSTLIAHAHAKTVTRALHAIGIACDGWLVKRSDTGSALAHCLFVRAPCPRSPMPRQFASSLCAAVRGELGASLAGQKHRKLELEKNTQGVSRALNFKALPSRVFFCLFKFVLYIYIYLLRMTRQLSHSDYRKTIKWIFSLFFYLSPPYIL